MPDPNTSLELKLCLLNSREANEFLTWLYRKIEATPDGYVVPTWVRLSIHKEDRIKPALWHIQAIVPRAWTAEIRERVATLLNAGLVIEA